MDENTVSFLAVRHDDFPNTMLGEEFQVYTLVSQQIKRWAGQQKLNLEKGFTAKCGTVTQLRCAKCCGGFSTVKRKQSAADVFWPTKVVMKLSQQAE